MANLKKEYENVVKNIAENLQDKDNFQYVMDQIDILIKAFTRRNGKTTKNS